MALTTPQRTHDLRTRPETRSPIRLSMMPNPDLGPTLLVNASVTSLPASPRSASPSSPRVLDHGTAVEGFENCIGKIHQVPGTPDGSCPLLATWIPTEQPVLRRFRIPGLNVIAHSPVPAPRPRPPVQVQAGNQQTGTTPAGVAVKPPSSPARSENHSAESQKAATPGLTPITNLSTPFSSRTRQFLPSSANTAPSTAAAPMTTYKQAKERFLARQSQTLSSVSSSIQHYNSQELPASLDVSQMSPRDRARYETRVRQSKMNVKPLNLAASSSQNRLRQPAVQAEGEQLQGGAMKMEEGEDKIQLDGGQDEDEPELTGGAPGYNAVMSSSNKDDAKEEEQLKMKTAVLYSGVNTFTSPAQEAVLQTPRQKHGRALATSQQFLTSASTPPSSWLMNSTTSWARSPSPWKMPETLMSPAIGVSPAFVLKSSRAYVNSKNTPRQMEEVNVNPGAGAVRESDLYHQPASSARPQSTSWNPPGGSKLAAALGTSSDGENMASHAGISNKPLDLSTPRPAPRTLLQSASSPVTRAAVAFGGSEAASAKGKGSAVQENTAASTTSDSNKILVPKAANEVDEEKSVDEENAQKLQALAAEVAQLQARLRKLEAERAVNQLSDAANYNASSGSSRAGTTSRAVDDRGSHQALAETPAHQRERHRSGSARPRRNRSAASSTTLLSSTRSFSRGRRPTGRKAALTADEEIQEFINQYPDFPLQIKKAAENNYVISGQQCREKTVVVVQRQGANMVKFGCGYEYLTNYLDDLHGRRTNLLLSTPRLI
ncbi:unnamed protein product [Amoebophrya sp. A120]|nr:unnamed protein product [Amoebophrya sp. A120]|eukprot:GSA120T00002113001.1